MNICKKRKLATYKPKWNKALIVFIPLFFILGCINKRVLHAQKMQTVNISQFGFNGNGITNNSAAFKRLSNYIRGKKNLRIVFPKGTYIVGVQNKSELRYRAGHNMLDLRNCSNIILDGNNARFKYADNLKFGSFDPNTGLKYVPKKKLFTQQTYAAVIGSFILLYESNNIQIKNFRLDGNTKNFILGGKWGDTGIQLDHTGIRIIKSRDVDISNCKIEHFGLDGIYIHNKTPQDNRTKPQNIRINNVQCLYPGRQGLSWTGGSGLEVINSEFSYAARGAVSSAPAAGIDIEPHKGLTCVNAVIKNCVFKENSVSGFISDFKGYRFIYNILIDDCYFKAARNSAIFPRNGGITISNSQIIGPCIGLRGTKDNPSKIINCYFTDSLFNHSKPRYFPYFVHCHTHTHYSIENCTFSMYRFQPLYISSNATTQAAQPLLKSNKFYFRYTDKPVKPWVSILRNLVLDDNIFIDRTGSNSGYKMYLNTKTGKVVKNKYYGTNKIISNNEFGWGRTTGVKTISKSAERK